MLQSVLFVAIALWREFVVEGPRQFELIKGVASVPHMSSTTRTGALTASKGSKPEASKREK